MAIRPCIAALRRCWRPHLLDPQLGVPHHLAPFIHLQPDAGAELIRRIRDRIEAERGEAFLHFGLGHGNGAHAPDEYYVIESKNPKLQGLDGAIRSQVEYLYELAAVS